jgi:hypothetical protein
VFINLMGVQILPFVGIGDEIGESLSACLSEASSDMRRSYHRRAGTSGAWRFLLVRFDNLVESPISALRFSPHHCSVS